jgi:hypothetical protein
MERREIMQTVFDMQIQLVGVLHDYNSQVNACIMLIKQLIFLFRVKAE